MKKCLRTSMLLLIFVFGFIVISIPVHAYSVTYYVHEYEAYIGNIPQLGLTDVTLSLDQSDPSSNTFKVTDGVVEIRTTALIDIGLLSPIPYISIENGLITGGDPMGSAFEALTLASDTVSGTGTIFDGTTLTTASEYDFVFNPGNSKYEGIVNMIGLVDTPLYPSEIEFAAIGGKVVLGQNPVPEPATMLLLGSGLVGLAGFRRKFKK